MAHGGSELGHENVNSKVKIFISYARKDGYDHAQVLREKLIDEGFEIWQDLIAMNIGENWEPQIFKAIEEAKVVVLVLTPAALKSPMVRQEWVHARRVGTPIFPIAFSDIYKETNVPRWVKKVDAPIVSPDVVGSDDKWHSFLDQLRNPKPRNKVPNMVERLPAEYVERHTLYNAVLNSLLDEEGVDPRHTDATSHIVTLLGEGGFGKTTLSKAIGFDLNITETFTGGVLSVTIGESATNLTENWDSMLWALTGSGASFHNPIEQLKLKLQGDDFLIILDDVWNKDHITPILNIPRCTYLITTRDDSVAALATDTACQHNVAEMLPEEARDVLLNYIPSDKRPQPTEPIPEDLKRFAAELGEWPLLLDIHGNAIREECGRGLSVTDALAYVREGLAEEGLDPFPKGQDADTRRRTLNGSMNASLRRYTDDEKQHLYELAIFPEDTAIPQVAVLKLWEGTEGPSGFKGKELLRQIAGHFCRIHVEEGGLVIRFHDKIREYLEIQLRKHLKTLQKDIPVVHQALLDAYRKTQTGDGWHTVSDDGYIFDHLVYHLSQAQRYDDIHGLFCSRDWADIRSVTGLLRDFEVARQLPQQDIATKIRYRFFSDVVSSRYRHLPITVLAGSMQAELVVDENLISAARNMKGSHRDKLKIYMNIWKLKHQSLNREQFADEIIETMSDWYWSSGSDWKVVESNLDVVLDVINVFTGIQQAKMLDLKRAIWQHLIDPPTDRDLSLLKKLVDKLSPSELLALRDDLINQNDRFFGFRLEGILKSLEIVVPHLETQERYRTWRSVLEVVMRLFNDKREFQEMKRERKFWVIFRYLLPNLPADLIQSLSDQFWEAVLEPTWSDYEKDYTFLHKIMPYIPPHFMSKVWMQAKISWHRGPCFVAVAQYLPHEYLLELSERNVYEGSEYYVEVVLTERLRGLTPEQRRERYLNALEKISSSSYDKENFNTILARIPEDIILFAWEDTLSRLKTLSYVRNTRGDYWGYDRNYRPLVNKLLLLASHFPRQHIRETCISLVHEYISNRFLSDWWADDMTRLVSALVNRLPEEKADSLWKDVYNIILSHFADARFNELAIRLTEHVFPLACAAILREQVLTKIREIENPSTKVYLLTRLALYSPDNQQTDLWLEAWSEIQMGDLSDGCSYVLWKLSEIYDKFSSQQKQQLSVDLRKPLWKYCFEDILDSIGSSITFIIRHSSSKFASKVLNYYQSKQLELSDDIGMILLPFMPPEIRDESLGLIFDRYSYYEGFEEKFNVFIETWPDDLVWQAWYYCSRKFSESQEPSEDEDFQKWAVFLSSYLVDRYAIQAWELLVEAGYLQGGRWRWEAEIGSRIAMRLPDNYLITAWNQIENAKPKQDDEMAYDKLLALKIVIAPRLPPDFLPSLLSKSQTSNGLTFPAGIFTTWWHTYFFYLSYARIPMNEAEGVVEQAIERVVARMLIVASRIFTYFSYIVVPIYLCSIWIWQHLGKLQRIINILGEVLYWTYWILMYILHIAGSLRDKPYLGTLITVILVILAIFLIPLVLPFAILKLLLRLTKPHYHFAWIHNLREVEAQEELNQIIDHHPTPLDLVEARPLLQKIGGKELRHSAGKALGDAQSWWKNAVIRA